ncbi:hypothetical protein [Clostridium botulinum]|uniref:DUF8042 domain-containing protein n=1 Tax=Clostridium botulinum TaxID=1491 RepID=A0A9Q1ZGJ6_CLOBO|nr:hypothetical protein [Clostridium botulinum]AEB75786.1 conserved hypothetical protein [Clostridium botulinum BKT015925]KEH98578.1 hypothetical protein Z953_12865 [Clostridium botulinum D str. 16868]KEI05758.1 hypothetical protein Y848_03480 [Clostridium botulinum C/D str. Sp77]KLU75623.1 hypothetical protein CBC3_07640 [Clostridium botulinum V891]KOA75304.1 hypothetical protein ADU78_08955 [Clostridium botulinum]
MNEKIEALITANEYLTNLKGGINQLIEAFEVDNYNKGCSLIPLVAEGIEWFTDIVKLTSDVQKKPIKISNINNILEEVVEAIENEDYTLVGDLFKYEILPILDNAHIEISKLIAS